MTDISRRKFIAATGVASAAIATGGLSRGPHAAFAATAPSAAAVPPIGIELYAVRGELARDLPNTLRTVAKIGYKVVEFYAPYMGWTFPYAKDVRMQLDDLGLRCNSTHNPFASFTPGDSMAKAIELNQIIGARQIIVASPPGGTKTADDWKRVAAPAAVA